MNIVWVLIVATSMNSGYILKNKFPTKEACEKFITFSGHPEINKFCTPRRSFETDFIKE